MHTQTPDESDRTDLGVRVTGFRGHGSGRVYFALSPAHLKIFLKDSIKNFWIHMING